MSLFHPTFEAPHSWRLHVLAGLQHYRPLLLWQLLPFSFMGLIIGIVRFSIWMLRCVLQTQYNYSVNEYNACCCVWGRSRGSTGNLRSLLSDPMLENELRSQRNVDPISCLLCISILVVIKLGTNRLVDIQIYPMDIQISLKIGTCTACLLDNHIWLMDIQICNFDIQMFLIKAFIIVLKTHVMHVAVLGGRLGGPNWNLPSFLSDPMVDIGFRSQCKVDPIAFMS